MSASPAQSSRTFIKMKSLNFPSMGKLTEVYKPQLGFAKDSLEIRWEVEGKSLKVELPRSNLKLNKETIDDPSLLEVSFSPKNHLKRYFLEKSQSDGSRKLVTMIAIPQSIPTSNTAPWHEWVKGMEYIDSDVVTPATRAQHLEDLMTICNQLTSLGVGQLRKSTYVTLPPAGSRASPVKRIATESPLTDSKKVTEFLDPANDGEDEDELDDEDDTTRRKEPGSPIVEKHEDPTLPQDVGKFLSEWQDLSKRIEVGMSDLAQKEQDAVKKLAILKHKEDEIAARENSLHRREKIIKKAVQDLQSLNAK